jgi:hypothetical protein
MATDLAPEDDLRLNVLLAGVVHAVRIDEGAMVLHALTPQGEAKVVLHRNCRPDLYVQRVRELLGGHAMGSPGGYPVHLMRWTSMGQSSAKNLQALLLLGEPEAVKAVAQAPTLSDELARRAWWALPTMEVARYMLNHALVRSGAMGPVLADFLIEHLPFEEDPIQAMNAIRAVVGAGLLDPVKDAQLWAKAKHRPHYFLGFLEHRPDDLPADTERPVPEYLVQRAAAGDALAQLFVRCYGPSGQSFLRVSALVLEKPPAPEAVFLMLDILGRYFSGASGLDHGADWPEHLQGEAQAMAMLGRLSHADARPILNKTTAVGPLMRRHLEPLFQPVLAHIHLLRGHP